MGIIKTNASSSRISTRHTSGLHQPGVSLRRFPSKLYFGRIVSATPAATPEGTCRAVSAEFPGELSSSSEMASPRGANCASSFFGEAAWNKSRVRVGHTRAKKLRSHLPIGIIDAYYFFPALCNPTGALDLPTLKQSNMDAKDTTVEARRMRYASCGPCVAGRQFYGGTTKMLLT